MVPRADILERLVSYSCGILVQTRTGCHNVCIEMVMTEYESQHAAWQKDHDTVMAEMDAYHKIGPAWTVVTIPNDISVSPVTLNRTWGDCYDWCVATWGRNDEWVYMGPGKFHFKNNGDAAMFILKWVR